MSSYRSNFLGVVCAVFLGFGSASAQTSGLPSGWSNGDVGSPALAGRVDASAEVIAVSGAGVDIWESADQFHFAYRPITGDVDVKVRLASLANVDLWTKAGVMIRESLDAGSRHAFILASSGRGLDFQWRSQPNALTARAGSIGGSAPVWLRLVRKGSLFSAYTSPDGTTWSLLSSAAIDMPADVHAGLAVTSHDPTRLAEAKFTNLRLVTPSAEGWTGVDVGDPALTGSHTLAGDAMTVLAAGADIWGASDQFHLVFRPVTGDADIVARVAQLEATESWAKAGVMIRETLSADSAHASMLATGSEGWGFQHRPWAGGESVHRSGGVGTPPGWVRLTRVGDLFSAYQSADGQTWRLVGSATIPMAATVHIGLALTSHVTFRYATVMFDGIAVGAPGTSGPEGATPPPGEETPPSDDPAPNTGVPEDGTNLPSEWQTRDVGEPAIAGTAAHDAGTFTVTGAGVDIWNQADEFRFVYRPVTGDAEIVARVASLLAVDRWSKGGVMIREALTAPSAHASVFATGSKGWVLQHRRVAGGASYTTPGASGTAPGWVRLVRNGDVFSGFISPDGVNWTPLGSQTIPMQATVYVGLAVTSHNVSTPTTAVFSDVDVSVPAAGGLTGTLTVQNASGGSTFLAPANVLISASYTDGTPAKVDFYRGETLLGSDSSSPFSMTWSNVPAGDYTINAVARDAAGAALLYTSARVVVSSSSTAVPTMVVFVPSTDHDTAVAGYTLELRRAGEALTASPVATRDLGKPQVVNGEITVDISAVVNGLPAGSYYAAVFARGTSGSSTRAVSEPFSK